MWRQAWKPLCWRNKTEVDKVIMLKSQKAILPLKHYIRQRLSRLLQRQNPELPFWCVSHQYIQAHPDTPTKTHRHVQTYIWTHAETHKDTCTQRDTQIHICTDTHIHDNFTIYKGHMLFWIRTQLLFQIIKRLLILKGIPRVLNFPPRLQDPLYIYPMLFVTCIRYIKSGKSPNPQPFPAISAQSIQKELRSTSSIWASHRIFSVLG